MKLLHFILIFLLIAVVYSQDGSSREILSDSLYEQENRKSIESMMIWKLTEELELEVDQAEKFFPRFRQHRAEMENLRRKQRSLAGSLKLNMKNEKLTSSEVSRIIKETSSLKRKMSDLEEKFLINAFITQFDQEKEVIRHIQSDKINIEFSTGRLTISIDENNSIHMKGPVSDIKEIDIEI